MGGSILFTSQYGTVNLASLPIISIDGHPPAAPRPLSAPAAAAPATGAPSAREADLFAAIERLADLRAKGILSDEEFTQKKAELLSRL
jgi:hypothetical protein